VRSLASGRQKCGRCTNQVCRRLTLPANPVGHDRRCITS
jgi:hypothetical protein